jgi:serine phosphatase RsbU (regulator of sigma subunit)
MDLSLALTIALVAIAGLQAWQQDRREKRHAIELQRGREERARLLEAYQKREQGFERERQLLLNRIQAPETAVAQAQVLELPDTLPYVPFEDDEAFFEADQERRRGS